MANLIKQPVGKAVGRGEGLPFDELSRRAERCLEEARGQAQSLRKEAALERDALRQELLAELRQEAAAELERRVAAELEERLASLVPTLEESARQLSRAGREARAAEEAACLRVAVAIAERIIRRELRGSSDIPLALVREALELAGGSPTARLLIHPADEPALRPHLAALLAKRGARSVEVVADPAITSGGCRVETRHGVIDQQIETQLRRMFEELCST